MKHGKLILTLAGSFVLGWVCNCVFNTNKQVRDDFREKLRIDTVYLKKTDTVPPKKEEKVTGIVNVPVPTDSEKVDSIPMQVVQRTYTDDSTYTAFVSGVLVDSLPRLDSITVKQRTITITHDVERTITKRKRLTYGIQVGTGYGIITHRPDIYLGLGVHINFK